MYLSLIFYCLPTDFYAEREYFSIIIPFIYYTFEYLIITYLASNFKIALTIKNKVKHFLEGKKMNNSFSSWSLSATSYHNPIARDFLQYGFFIFTNKNNDETKVCLSHLVKRRYHYQIIISIRISIRRIEDKPEVVNLDRCFAFPVKHAVVNSKRRNLFRLYTYGCIYQECSFYCTYVVPKMFF